MNQIWGDIFHLQSVALRITHIPDLILYFTIGSSHLFYSVSKINTFAQIELECSSVTECFKWVDMFVWVCAPSNFRGGSTPLPICQSCCCAAPGFLAPPANCRALTCALSPQMCLSSVAVRARCGAEHMMSGWLETHPHCVYCHHTSLSGLFRGGIRGSVQYLIALCILIRLKI